MSWFNTYGPGDYPPFLIWDGHGTWTTRTEPIKFEPEAHEHVWQPVSVAKVPVYGTTGYNEYIYALCQCGEARKFPVKPHLAGEASGPA